NRGGDNDRDRAYAEDGANGDRPGDGVDVERRREEMKDGDAGIHVIDRRQRKAGEVDQREQPGAIAEQKTSVRHVAKTLRVARHAGFVCATRGPTPLSTREPSTARQSRA